MFDLSNGEAQAPAVQHHGSGMPQELSSGSRPEAASILPQNTSPDAGSGDTSHPAETFLQLIGKDPAQTWFRTFSPGGKANRTRSGRDLHGFDAAALEANNQAGEAIYLITGDADQATGWAIADADINRCTSVFVEWDDRPIEWQLQAWQELGLPEPTAMVTTGGKSVHCYWRLREPMAPDEWRVLQRQLIEHASGDTACKNPSRLMRLPGFHYVDKATGQITDNVAELIHSAGTCYTAEELEVCLLPPQEPTPPPTPRLQLLTNDLPAREVQEIRDAVAVLPKRSPQTYEQFRNALCGCSAALSEAGIGDADGEAIRLMAHLWEGGEVQAAQILRSTTTRNAASFWAIAREHGHNLKRSATQRPENTGAPATTKTQPKPRPKKERKPRKLGHTRAMACFERCVEIQAKRERNSLRRRARLLAIAKALGLAGCVNRQEIAQRVLDAKDEQQGHSFKALTAADRLAMQTPVVRWLIADLVPAGDLTIIGGRPKVGKTRLAVAIAAAVLKSEPFAGFGCTKEPRPVLLITDDQADGDTHQMLHQLKVWDHPHLMWSRHFRLNDRDIDAMLETIRANPGALVVVDSLRSVSRSLPAGENDPEIGAYLYDLKAAVIEAGGSLIVIHHCNKAADLVGTEALSGHNAIAGAANTVITLHHCPDANGRPDKSNTQRRLFSEGRSGAGCDVVIDRQAGGGYRQVCGFDQWQQQLSEAKRQQQASEGLTGTQQQLLELLEEEPGQAFTRRELVEALGLDWGDGRGSGPKRVRESLNRLVTLELIAKSRAGKEVTFTASHDGQKETSPSSPSSPSSDTKGFQGDAQGDADVSFVSFQSGQGVSVNGTDPVEAPAAELHPSPPAKETKETFGVSETSPSDPLLQLEGDEGDEGDAHKHRREKKRAAQPLLTRSTPPIGSGADVMDDGDDPHWGPKPQGAAA